MEPIIIDLTKNSTYTPHKIDSSISFRNFISFIEKKADEAETVKKNFLGLALNKFKENPEFLGDISLEQIPEFREQLDLVYGLTVPSVADEKQVFWALSVPVSPIVFYGTPGFYNLVTEKLTGMLRCDLIDDSMANVKQKVVMLYSFILEKLYHFPPIYQKDLIITLNDEKSGLQKYYRLNVDNSFCDVYAKGSLPELNIDEIREEMQEAFDISVFAKLLPDELFRFEGFSVVTLTDVTAEHAVENIKNIILDRASNDPNSYFKFIAGSLKMLVENNHIDFGLVPVLKVNNKLVFDRSAVLYSKIMQAATHDDSAEEMYLNMANHYFQQPKVLFMRTLDGEDKEGREFIRLLKDDGVEAYALLPVYYDNKVVGLLEVYSREQKAVNEKGLAKLGLALPLIAQVMQNHINEFNTKIDNVIREKFTSLQPAVQWRFRETAWHYLRDQLVNPQSAYIENIQFKDVYPLYGAIDIRNSTIERNIALKDDLKLQFNALIETFTILKQKLGFGLADEMIFKCRKWVDEINENTTGNDEMKVKDFLENEAHPFLRHFKEDYQEEFNFAPGAATATAAETRLMEVIDKYFEIIDEQKGAGYANRRALEASMQMINSSVNLYLDLFRKEIQLSYPCYFEKFRTDGIEYDIYIGQAIEPEKKFNELYLKNIRLWQLTAMAAIARITHSLIPQMAKPLETTQLIFTHSSSIDISFRDDERRFDVEGAYNIRYQVIKKRIDKVRIKGTGERLTQPGKVALVYFNTKSAEEYVGYIRYLQEKNTLQDNLEYLELEELQGVTGLKALRIGVNLDSGWE